MNIALRKAMTREAFFPWAQRHEERYEFDGFQPVCMTGRNLGHARLIRNVNRQLGNRLTGKSCESIGPETGVATIGDAVRYPDAVVTCSTFGGRDLLVPNPVIVFEVLSPSSIRRDRVTKLREYEAVPSIRRYIIVEPEQMILTVLFRDDAGQPFKAAALAEGDTLALPEIGIEIPLADIYEGVALDEPPVDQT